MNRWLLSACLILGASSLSMAQSGFRVDPNDPNILIPESSIPIPGTEGVLAHTNTLLYVGPWNGPRIYPEEPLSGPFMAPGPAGYSPQQLRQAYGLPSTGGSGLVCIVDAFNYPTALSDFNTYSAQYGLPQETSPHAGSSKNKHFQVVFATGHKPADNQGWALEMALDIEIAHAMAPSAKIVLVEAASNSLSDLMTAENVAAGLAGCREVSNSWGTGEFSGETGQDSNFVHTGVVFFASSGDTGGQQIYPGMSPDVVCAGGTSLPLDSNGNRTGPETGWSGSGGGPSAYEPLPTYQNAISGLTSSRGGPDISFDADPNTGVALYDSFGYGWAVVGGTSVSSPALAGIANLAGHHLSSSNAELTDVYNNLVNHYSRYLDITSGSAGSFSCMTGWDFVTGVGVVNGTSGI